MPNTKPFSQLRDEARRDPRRAWRIEEAKRRALDDIVQRSVVDSDHAADPSPPENF